MWIRGRTVRFRDRHFKKLQHCSQIPCDFMEGCYYYVTAIFWVAYRKNLQHWSQIARLQERENTVRVLRRTVRLCYTKVLLSFIYSDFLSFKFCTNGGCPKITGSDFEFSHEKLSNLVNRRRRVVSKIEDMTYMHLAHFQIT